jgi:hypothetical protein
LGRARRDVGRLEEIGDHGEQIGAGGDQRRGIFEGNAADRAQRHAQVRGEK